MPDPDPVWDAIADQLGSDEMQDAINRRGDQTRENRS